MLLGITIAYRNFSSILTKINTDEDAKVIILSPLVSTVLYLHIINYCTSIALH